MMAAGQIDYAGFLKLVASSAPSTGFCNTMGTATTMNSLTEALGMSLPGSAAIPAPHRDRQECAWDTGRQIVDMVHADRKPSDILTRTAFLNAIRVVTAIGGSSNAQPHIHAMAKHAGIEITAADWSDYGYDLPLLVDVQPAGRFLGERFHRAGGVPAVLSELLAAGRLDDAALAVGLSSSGLSGGSMGGCVGMRQFQAEDVDARFDQVVHHRAVPAGGAESRNDLRPAHETSGFVRPVDG